jgi:hypothetical protein
MQGMSLGDGAQSEDAKSKAASKFSSVYSAGQQQMFQSQGFQQQRM